MPNLDMGGKCVAAGTKLWIVPLRDRKGQLVGPDAVSPKYGTPKCEFTTRLVRVDESELHSNYTPTWVGGHPSLGESLAEELLARHVQGISTIPGMGPVTSVKNQVMIGPHTRADFMLNTTAATTDDDEKKPPVHRQRIVEVKTVVDTDYCASWPLPERRKCVFVSQDDPSVYQRTALFPWGQSHQKGLDGEKVVSTRAIKHVRELTQLVQEGTYDATILFLVIRGDAQVFRPNQEACPSFARYLQQAQAAGVQVLAKRVQWDEVDIGTCHDDKWLDVVFAETK
jgi:DNA-binding sugar fermentation-stimulating protein